LQRRHLSTSGSKTVLIKRLQASDRKTIIKATKRRHDALKEELESKTGQSVNATEALKNEDDLTAMDHKIPKLSSAIATESTHLQLRLEGFTWGKQSRGENW
jgi:hypothetical protein